MCFIVIDKLYVMLKSYMRIREKSCNLFTNVVLKKRKGQISFSMHVQIEILGKDANYLKTQLNKRIEARNMTGVKVSVVIVSVARARPAIQLASGTPRQEV